MAEVVDIVGHILVNDPHEKNEPKFVDDAENRLRKIQIDPVDIEDRLGIVVIVTTVSTSTKEVKVENFRIHHPLATTI